MTGVGEAIHRTFRNLDVKFKECLKYAKCNSVKSEIIISKPKLQRQCHHKSRSASTTKNFKPSTVARIEQSGRDF